MPRGGMDPFHLLIVPIACIGTRQHLTLSMLRSVMITEIKHYVDAISDMHRYEEAVDKLFEKLNCTSIKFERYCNYSNATVYGRNESLFWLTRFIRSSKGKDHLVAHMVPIPYSRAHSVRTTPQSTWSMPSTLCRWWESSTSMRWNTEENSTYYRLMAENLLKELELLTWYIGR